MNDLVPAEGENGLLVPVSEEELGRLVVCVLGGNGNPMTAEAMTTALLDILYVKVEVQIRCAIARMALAGEFLIDASGRLRLRPKETKAKTPLLPKTEEPGVCIVSARPGSFMAGMIEEAGAAEIYRQRPDIEQRRCSRCKAFTLEHKCPSCAWPTTGWRPVSPAVVGEPTPTQGPEE